MYMKFSTALYMPYKRLIDCLLTPELCKTIKCGLHTIPVRQL